MSLQDLGGAGSGRLITRTAWPVEIMDSLCQAILQGVHIYLVLSTPNTIPDELSMLEANYGNGWDPQKVARQFIVWLGRYTKKHSGEDNTASFRAKVCEQVHLTTIRYTEEEAEWVGATREAGKRIGNHAKLYIVDDEIFYLGSESLYPASLAEYGLIVDDKAVTTDLVDSYWNNLWRASSKGSVSGNDVHCQL